MLVCHGRDGIQHRRNSWQDGVLGTNCPIPAGWNWTYQFQVKDQIGSFFYFPSLNFQRAAGGYGGIIVNNRAVIAVPFGDPDGDITLFIGDWYNRNHTVSVLAQFSGFKCFLWLNLKSHIGLGILFKYWKNSPELSSIGCSKILSL